jgi:hypothetical protein
LVDLLKLGNNMQSDFGILILEHLQKHGKQVIDSPATVRHFPSIHQSLYILLLSENRSESTDLCSKRSSDMLRTIRDEIFNARHNIVEKNRTVDKRTEPGNLAGNSSPDFRLIILEHLDKRRYQIPRYNLLIYSLGNLQQLLALESPTATRQTYAFEPIGNHVTNPPALVFYQIAQRRQENAVAGLLLGGNDLGNRNENLNRQQADAVLVVLYEVLKEGYHVFDNNGGWHFFDKLGHVGGGLTADHRGLIVYEEAKLAAQLLLDGRRDLFVGSCKEATAGNLGRKPVGFGQADSEGNKVLLDLSRREFFANFVKRFDGLTHLLALSATG